MVPQRLQLAPDHHSRNPDSGAVESEMASNMHKEAAIHPPSVSRLAEISQSAGLDLDDAELHAYRGTSYHQNHPRQHSHTEFDRLEPSAIERFVCNHCYRWLEEWNIEILRESSATVDNDDSFQAFQLLMHFTRMQIRARVTFSSSIVCCSALFIKSRRRIT